jgi:methionyl-tRNA formyltransferase
LRILLLGNDTETKRICYRVLSWYYYVETEPSLCQLCVLVNYPHIVNKEFIAQFPKGVINLHAGMLPNYRGRHPVVWAMINGESKIGLTVHYVDENIDAGDIILQDSIPITCNDKYDDVLKKINEEGSRLLLQAVDLIDQDKAPRTPQTEGTYYKRRTPEDSNVACIMNDNLTPRKLVGFINALSGTMPNAYIDFPQGRVYLEGARYEERD